MSPGRRDRDGAPVAEPPAPAGATGAPGEAVTASGRLGAERAAAKAGLPSAAEASRPGGATDNAPPAPWSSDATEAPPRSEAVTEAPPARRRAGGRRSRAEGDAGPPARVVDYHTLRNPFPPVDLWPRERVEAIHAAAFEVLDDLGMKVLLPEARGLYEGAGAQVEGDLVHLPRGLVEDALAAAPRSVTLRAGRRAKDVVLEMGRLTIQTGAGAPHVSDRERGRRPADLAAFEELLKLTQSFDVFHMLNPAIEPQDVPTHLRHYAVTRAQLALSDKVPFVFSRGTPQAADAFEMIRIMRGLDRAAFEAEPWCTTIVNTNSPRQLDVPMGQGLIDFARAGQLSIVTPFCLMGAMAPVTIAGALTLSHAEAMAAIALTQIVRPGAPVCYGSFTSNVDMRSGAPAFGTPEHVKANLGAGQLARRLGLPWRSAAGAAGCANDAQGAHETQMSAWGAVLAGATVLIHGAGWIEGGLTVSFEKLITDLEAMQTLAELCIETPAGEEEIAMDALREVPPGGHFFGAAHTMARYATTFYQPVVADWSNHGTWTERGALDADARATRVWKETLAAFVPPEIDPERLAAIDAFVARRTAEGGAPPES